MSAYEYLAQNGQLALDRYMKMALFLFYFIVEKKVVLDKNERYNSYFLHISAKSVKLQHTFD